MKELEHYDPYFDIRKEKAKAGKEAIGEFLYDEATDPLNYLGLGAGKAAKLLGKGMFAALMAGKASDADAMMFGGKYLNKELIPLLEKALESGESADKIFRSTGYFKDPRGQWRKYVPDQVINPSMDVAQTIERFKKLEDPKAFLKHIFESPALKEDPNLGTIPVKAVPKELSKQGHRGWYNPEEREAAIAQRLDPFQFRKTAGHETQHAVQNQGNLPYAERGSPANRFEVPKQRQERAANISRQHGQRIVNRVEQIAEQNKIPVTELWNYLNKMNPSYVDMPRGINKQLAEELQSLNRQWLDVKVFNDKFEKRVFEDPIEMYKANPGEVEARVTGENINRDFLEEGLAALNEAYDRQIGINREWYLNHEDFLDKIINE